MRHKWVKMGSSGTGGGCERKRTKGHLERGWVVVGGWEAEMHEWRRGAGGGGSWRGKQRSVGVWGAGMWWVMPRSDLISVFWLTGWEQREVRTLLTATHSALCQIWTVNQQADRLGYPIRHFFFLPPPTPSLPSTDLPPFSTSLDLPHMLNPWLNSITHAVHAPLRHLLLHQQVVGLEKGSSHQGTGSCEGYWFTAWPESFYLSIAVLFFTICFSPCTLKGLVSSDTDMRRTGKKKKKMKRRLCGWDKEMPKGMQNHLTLKERITSRWQSLW